MKRIVSLLLAMLMVLSLVGCGNKNSGNNGGNAGTNVNNPPADNTDNGDQGTDEVYGPGYVLRVGMNCSAAPFGWTQDDDSNGAWPIDGTNQYVCGYDVQVARKICETYGWELKIIKTDWEGLIPGVVSGKLDCCISTLGVTEERLRSVDFSDYYWNNGCIMAVRKDGPYVDATSIQDFDGAKITTQIATIWEPLVQQIPNVQAEPCLNSLPELFIALSAGKVDGVITGLSEAQSACLSNPDLTWVTFGEGQGFDVELSALCAGIPLGKGNTELKEKIDAVIATMDHDTQIAMMTEALNAQPLSDGTGEALQAEETAGM
ncbi:MAG: transporter substrate-binding domain-containing protein [Oscillospiraceae bacterium]|nr:transporter substrate-binding domain-containing protein [Oscillospiraceae bacterium]MCI9587601.1 transporter substrate-binding domain-containing protein [Oscillospiraceae bacterium]